MQIAKKILSVFLATLMVLGTIAIGGTGLVSATDADAAIRLATDGTAYIEGAMASSVWFGNYKQSSNGEGGFKVEPVKWRVLSNTGDALYLISDRNLDAFTYNKERAFVSWETCDLRQWLNGLNDYSTNNFKDNAFTAAEYAAIALTNVQNAVNSNEDYPSVESGSDTQDKVFLPSVGDMLNEAFGFKNVLDDYSEDVFDPARIATNTAYTASGGESGSTKLDPENDSDMYWLRTPGEYKHKAASVYGNGRIMTRGWDVDYDEVAVRPALNIDLGRVLFMSAPNGKQGGAFAAVSEYTGSEWKLTVLDNSRSAFTASSVMEGGACTITYSGAKTGTNEKISAMIVDPDGAVKYYGTLCDAARGENTVTLNVDGKLADDDNLYVFNEQLNGDKKTDYSSALIDVQPNKSIRIAADGALTNVEGAQTSAVWFGNYMQSSASSKEPVKWRVLSNADGELFLLSDQNLDVVQYNKKNDPVTWADCTLRKWLNGYNGTPYSDTFIGSAFSEKELNAVADSELTNDNNPHNGMNGGVDTTDKVFLLSIAEAKNAAYGFTNDDARVSTNTQYAANGGHTGGDIHSVGEGDYWWLRSPGDYDRGAAIVSYDGVLYIPGFYVDTFTITVRPALNVDLDKVLFTSPAVGGKQGTGALKTVSRYDGPDWKLTVLDDSRSAFTASSNDDGVRTITYSGAKTGTNEMISAIIVNADGLVTYYGALCEAQEGENTVTVNITGKLHEGDKFYVFNEQLNGDKKTDFASALVDVTNICEHVWDEPTWDWTQDVDNPTYSTTCSLCEDTAIGTVESEKGDRVEATVEADAYTPYTATVTLSGQTFTDTYHVEEPGTMDAARREAFDAYKEQMKQAAGDKALPGDSDECDQLINDAIDAIEDVTYNGAQTLQQNKDAVDAAANLAQLEADLAEHREIHYAEFYADGTLIESVPYTIDTDSITAPAVPDKTGHSGVWPDYTLKVGGTRIDAVYTPNPQTVNFDPNGGEGEMESVNTTWGSKITLPECTFTAPNGKAFDKWDAGDPGDEIEVKSDLTVKAIWKEEPLMLTADVDPTQTGERIAIRVPYAKRGAIAATLTASEDGVRYESSKPDVISVDENGVIRLEKLCLFCKTATITAYSADGQKVASCVVNVQHAWWQYIIWFFFGSFWF